MERKFTHCIKRFPKTEVLVIGDIMVDKFIYGNVSRISPEAPVPVVEVTEEKCLAGGAGNVSNNINSLNAKAYLAGIIGNDAVGRNLIENLKKKGIDIKGIFIDDNRPTSLKSRVVAHHQQVVRFDCESKTGMSSKITSQLLGYISEKIPKVNAVVISDYGKAVINQQVLKESISKAKKYKKPIIVDPKIEHFMEYREVTCITPNISEAIAGMRLYKVSSEKEIVALGQSILKQLNCNSVIITRGEKGMSVFEKNKPPLYIPTRAKEVFDVTGAGDTIVAVMSLCLATGADLRISAEIANYAAGIVVGKVGTATVSVEELRAAFQ